MKKVLMIAMFMLTACGDSYILGPEVPAPKAPVPAPPAVYDLDADIASLVGAENDYRLGLGQTMLSPGLSCALYTISGGDRIQASISGHNTFTDVKQVATFLMTGMFEQPDSSINDGLNVLPTPLREVYKNMYLLRCTGQIVVTETNYYKFDLYSDDASLLYLDGSLLVDNDNNHGATLVSRTKYLRRGLHTIRLDYAQAGGGNQALVLRAGGQSIDPKFFVH